MSTKLKSLGLSPDVPLGVPKPQFATIKPINIQGKRDVPFTGQFDVFHQDEDLLRPARDRASEAFLKANLRKFPQADVATEVTATSAKRKEADKVEADGILREMQRATKVEKGAKKMTAHLGPEKREREQSEAEQARSQSQSVLVKPSASLAIPTIDTFDKLSSLKKPVTIMFMDGSFMTGVLRNHNTIDVEGWDGNIISHDIKFSRGFPEVELNKKLLKVKSIKVAS